MSPPSSQPGNELPPPPSNELPEKPKPQSYQSFDDDYDSIAAPGGGVIPTSFAPLAGGGSKEDPITSLPKEDRPSFMPLPGFDSDPVVKPPEEESQSPFGSIRPDAVSQAPNPVINRPLQEAAPPEAEPGAEMDTSEAADQPPANVTSSDTDQVDPAANPYMTTPPNYGSIYAPGQMPQSPPPSPVPAQQESSPVAGNIWMPNQMPVVPPKRERPSDPQIELPPGKVAFWVRQQLNGVYFYSGLEVADVPLVRTFMSSRYQAIYCVNLAQLGIKENQPPETSSQPALIGEEPKTESSPFEDIEAENGGDSPFADRPEPATETGNSAEDKPEPRTRRIGDPLFSWFPKDLRWEQPVLLNDEEFDLDIESIWQKDSLVTFFGSSSKQMAEHCHKLIRMNIRTGQSGSMFGFCWPNVLDSALESMPEKLVGRIIDGGVAVVFMEDPQFEFAWNIISNTDLTESLVEAGFVLQPNE